MSTPGEVAYAAFWQIQRTDGHYHDPPPFDKLPALTRQAWEAAAQAVVAGVPEWRFALGQDVTWQEAPGAVWRIVGRRKHSYALVPAAEPEGTDWLPLIVDEAELAALEDDHA